MKRSEPGSGVHRNRKSHCRSCWSQHITATQDVALESEERQVEWWKVHEEKLPNWSSAVKKVLLIQPSSAAAERVFSLLSASFHKQQESALFDYLQASVMPQYNNRR